MLVGKHGEDARFAMRTLADIGEAYGAERVVDFAAQIAAWNAPAIFGVAVSYASFADCVARAVDG